MGIETIRDARILLTMREPYGKTYYPFTEVERATHFAVTPGSPSHATVENYFVVRWEAEDYDEANLTPTALTVIHPSGMCIYPWTSIQEMDVLEPERSKQWPEL